MKEKMFSKPDAFSKNHSVTQEETVLLLIQLHHVSLVTKHLERREKKWKRKKERRGEKGRERHRRQLFVTVKKYSEKSNVTISKLQKFRFFLLFLSGEKNQIKPTKISFSHLLSLFGVSLERERMKRKTNEMKCNLEPNLYLFNYTLDLIAIFTICET